MAATEAGKTAAEAAVKGDAGAEPDRHAACLTRDLGHRDRPGHVVGVGQQPERRVAGGGQHDQQRRAERGPALQRPRPGGEPAGLADQQPGQERLDQRLLHVQALGHVEHGTTPQQRHGGQPGQPLAAPEATGQQQQADPETGLGGRGGAHRHRPGDQLVERVEPVGLGRQQRRQQVEHTGQGGQGSGQPGSRPATPHPAAPGRGSMPGRRVDPGGRDRGPVAGHHGSGPPPPGAGQFYRKLDESRVRSARAGQPFSWFSHTRSAGLVDHG